MTETERPTRGWVTCEDPASRAAFLAWAVARASAGAGSDDALPRASPAAHRIGVMDAGRGADGLPRVLLEPWPGDPSVVPLLVEIDALVALSAGVALTLSVPLLRVVRGALDGSVVLGTVSQSDVVVHRGEVVVADRPPGASPLPSSTWAPPPTGTAWGGTGIAALVGLCRTVWRRVPEDDARVQAALAAVDVLVAVVRDDVDRGGHATPDDRARAVDAAEAAILAVAMPRPFRSARPPSGHVPDEPTRPGARGRSGGAAVNGRGPLSAVRARLAAFWSDGVALGRAGRVRLRPRHVLTAVLVAAGLVVAAVVLLDDGGTA